MHLPFREPFSSREPFLTGSITKQRIHTVNPSGSTRCPNGTHPIDGNVNGRKFRSEFEIMRERSCLHVHDCEQLYEMSYGIFS